MSDGGALGGLFGMFGDMYGAHVQGNAVEGAANTAANESRYATNQQINYLTQGGNVAEQEYRPVINQGNQATDLYRAAHGIGDQSAIDEYNRVYGNSYQATEAAQNANNAFQQLQSTNAAMGKGGAINSGKALRAAAEIGNEMNVAGRAAHASGLGALGDRGDAARVGLVNARLGQAGQIANAFANQGNVLAQNAQWRGANMANIGQQLGQNISGWAGYFTGNGNPFGGNTRGIQNAISTGQKPTAQANAFKPQVNKKY